MKRVIKQRLLKTHSHDREIQSTAKGIQDLAHDGLFSLYQKVVDKAEPDHILGSKNLACKRWRSGKVGSMRTCLAPQNGQTSCLNSPLFTPHAVKNNGEDA